MYDKIFEDPEVESFFEKTDKQRLKDLQIHFFTYLTGGPTTWEGKSMQLAHQGRGINETNFDRVALHTVVTMQEQ